MLKSNVEGLSKGSNKKVEAVCDFCGSDVVTTYKLYNRSYSKGGKFSCSRNCAFLKRKELLLNKSNVENPSQLDSVKRKRKKTNLEKFGVEYPFQSEEIRQKAKKTNLERWGFEHAIQSDIIKEKIKKTNLERWGFEHVLQSDYIKDKSKKTNLEKWGFEFAQQSDVIKDKVAKTNLEKYGFKSPTMSDDIKNKIKKTNLENFGVEHPTKLKSIKDKIIKTNLEKWGVEYPMQNKNILSKRIDNNIKKWNSTNNTNSDLFRIEKTKIGSEKNYLIYLGNRISLFKCDNGHNFEIHFDNYHSRKENNLSLCTVCNPIGDSQSIKEKEIFEWIISIYNGGIIQSYRDGLEIDIYLPELKIGFEFNGLYWHSEKYRHKSYHIEKTEFFDKRGIRIIHIWEDDWTFKNEIIKSQIKNIIGVTNNKLYARKCQVKEVKDVKLVRNFLDNNHIQGFVNSKIKLGLYYDGDLVSLMTFDKFEGRKSMDENGWNLSRFCNKLDTSVIGGASKLFKYFIDFYKPKRIISYADKDWSVGKLYEKIGFDKITEGNPDYKYIVDGKRIHKSRFRKSKLKTKLKEIDQMSNMNILKIWDCGKIKFEFLLN